MGARALTVRFPPELLDEAKEVRGQGESLNELVVAAVAREVGRRRARAALGAVEAVRDAIRRRHGLHPDSRSLIRALREGEGRRD